jgi:MoxR-like ATPase
MNATGFIRAVSTVTAEASVADRPAELADTWETDGHLVKSAYAVLKAPVALADINLDIRRDATEGPFDVRGAVKQGYLFPVPAELADAVGAASTELAELLFGTRKTSAPVIAVSHPVDVVLANVTSQLAERLLLTTAWLQDIVDMLREKRQVILYGPPGTGKTYVARALVDFLTEQRGSYEIVQFHPSYGYEDFVEGFRPAPSDDGVGVKYEIRWGPLRQLAARASQEKDKPHFLIIDEINRGNLPKILGELLYLLEYRGDGLALQYSPNERFVLPENLFLIGTMNTADRSIALVDQALRRRFLFKEFNPTVPPVSEVLGRWLKEHKHPRDAAQLLGILNTELAAFDVSIGPSYFMPRSGEAPNCDRVWNHSILPPLQEYFFGSPTDLQRFTLKGIQQKLQGEAPAETEDPE